MLFDIPKVEKSIIKVLGVGGGGSNAVTYMFKQGITGVDFAICNTDNQAMETSSIPVKINLGPELTGGRGAGSRPQMGKQACIESIDEIRDFVMDGTKMLFVTAGMGGGTGTGAAPIIAKAAREADILTVARAARTSISASTAAVDCIRARRSAAASRSSTKQLVLQLLGLLVGREHLLLVLLQFRRDVTLGVLERLLADVARRAPCRGARWSSPR